MMEKQMSDNSLVNLTPKEHRKEGMTAHARESRCLSPHISMPSAPPLWTDAAAGDGPIPRLSPTPINSLSLSPYKSPSKRRLLVKRPVAHHGSLHSGTNHTHADSHSNHHDSSDHPLLDDDSFGGSPHHNSNHDGPLHPPHLSLMNSNHNHSNHHGNLRRSKRKQRWRLEDAVRNSCWYAASAATAAQHGNHHKGGKRATKMTWRMFYTAFKVLVVAACAGFVYDSHHRVHTHKKQMEEYDHERREILEQMMWIDKAAKKVHKKYADSGTITDPVMSSSSTTATDSASLPQDLVGKTTATTHEQTQLQSLQTSLNQLKVHIQLNARDLLAEKFGDRPAQVSLQIRPPTTSSGGESVSSSATSANHDSNVNNIDNQHLVVALSDDTPHATATFVQQIDKHFWDDLEFETVTGTSSVSSDSIQAVQIMSKTRNIASPLLEFVEASRACHQVGSVALRQVPDGPFHHVLVLRIYVTEQDQQHSHHNGDDGDDGQEVCIGKVLHGLDQVLLPELLHEKQQEQEQQQQQQEELEDEYHGGPPEEEITLDLRQQDESPQVIDNTNPRDDGIGGDNKEATMDLESQNDEGKSKAQLRGSLP